MLLEASLEVAYRGKHLEHGVDSALKPDFITDNVKAIAHNGRKLLTHHSNINIRFYVRKSGYIFRQSAILISLLNSSFSGDSAKNHCFETSITAKTVSTVNSSGNLAANNKADNAAQTILVYTNSAAGGMRRRSNLYRLLSLVNTACKVAIQIRGINTLPLFLGYLCSIKPYTAVR